MPLALVAAAALFAPAAAHAAPTITIGDASVAEGQSATTKISFPITATDLSGDVTIAVATRPGSAMPRDDFTPRLAVFTIPDLGGPNTNYRFDVPITGDLVFEPTETFTVAYRVIPAGEVPPAQGEPGTGLVPDLLAEPTAATGTILDDDAPYTAPAAGPPPPPVTPAAAPAPPPAPTPTPPKKAASAPKLTTVATLPSTKRCVSRRRFRIRLRSPKGAKIASATVRLRGRTVATRKGKRVTAPIDLRGLPKGKFKVSIRIALRDGRVVKGTRTYRTCVPKRKRSGRARPRV